MRGTRQFENARSSTLADQELLKEPCQLTGAPACWSELAEPGQDDPVVFLVDRTVSISKWRFAKGIFPPAHRDGI